MERQRVVLAVLLMLLVWFLPMVIWPPKPKPAAGRLSGSADSAALRDSVASANAPSQPAAQPLNRPTAAADTGRTIWVTSPLYRLGFSTHGATLSTVELLKYQSFAARDSSRPVQLVPQGDAFLRHRLVLASGDTVALDDWNFQPQADVPGIVVYAGQSAQPLRFEAERGGSRGTIEYRFVPDAYHFDVRGTVTGLGAGGAVLLVDLAQGLRSVEKDSLDDYRHYSVVTKASKTERTDFSRIKPGERAVQRSVRVGRRQVEVLLHRGARARGRATEVRGRHRGRRAAQRSFGLTGRRDARDSGPIRRRFPLPGLYGTARPAPAHAHGARARRRQSLRRHLPAHHPAGLGGRRQHPALDARAPASRLRLGADSVRDRDSRGALAAQSKGDGVGNPDAGGRAAAEGDAGQVQERSRAAAARDAADLQGVQGEPARRLPADAAAVAGAARAILRVREHDRVPRRAVPLASRPLARRSVQDHPDRPRPLDVRAFKGRPDRRAAESPGEDHSFLHADLHDGAVPELRVGIEPVLRRAEHFQHSPAVPHREEAPTGGAGRRGGRARAGTGQDLVCSPTSLSRSPQLQDAPPSP